MQVHQQANPRPFYLTTLGSGHSKRFQTAWACPTYRVLIYMYFQGRITQTGEPQRPILFRMGCPTCCSSCMIRVCQNTPEYNSPFSLRNFLPAGTIRVPLRPDTQPACEHIHAQDDWHHFRPQTFLQHLTSDENVFLCQDIDFLVQKLFLAATFRCIGPATRMELTIRIYIIPWDLLGVQGALRNRTEDVLSPARRHFRSLLPKIEQDPSAWWCDESPSQSTNFLSEDNVLILFV